MLKGFQAGLSWAIIRKRRAAFREAFQEFAPEVAARFEETDAMRLLGDAGIMEMRGLCGLAP